MRRFFECPVKLGPGLGPAIVAFDLWIGKLKVPLDGAAAKGSAPGRVSNVIASVADRVAGNAKGLERELLRKSVEEILFIGAGQNTQISPRMAHNRWVRYIRSHGRPALIEMFLANHLWNVLWFDKGDALDQTGSRAAQRLAGQLRRTCRDLVTAVCRSRRLSDAVSLSAADEVVQALESAF